MVIRRAKKVRKYRGHITHGGGHRKKRRGAGSRGGRGRAGSGKRSGHKKNLFSPIGKHGFKSRKGNVRENVINVGDLTLERVGRWMNEGKALKEGAFFVVDLPKAGYQKLLGSGTTTLKLKVIAPGWSASAAEKIKNAGGEIVSDSATGA